MSALPDPPLTPDDRPLSDRERAVLDDIAGRENAGDPGFVTRLRATTASPGFDADRAGAARREVLARARRRDLAVQGAVVAGLAALLLPAAWVVAAVVTVVLLVLPLVLVGQAWREANAARPGHGGSGGPDRADGRSDGDIED